MQRVVLHGDIVLFREEKLAAVFE